MSSLIFYTDPKQVFVVTDTLAIVHQEDGSARPFLFTSKALYLPHLRMIVAGTGMGGFSDDWFRVINTQMLVHGIENLDEHAPRKLAELWDEFTALPEYIDGKTTTIYHFGISEESGEVAAFAYRSANGFASERIGYGIATKPGVEVPDGNLIDHIKEVMDRQRRSEAASGSADRVHIGGEAIAIHLTANECKHSSLFQFEDFEQDSAEAFSNV
ncbi:hypothetical protein [Pseudoxanthomonas winnipegensis]|uniref:Uncharacterized protein n=1 Tax=Pseudoxanthomonas winnipegensis TaxID=2480810 RepID=A0A4Q8LSB4_9GAMM|nr:hypothetical protein [Pseudoxanthomonas winnipegensis]RZZ84775.1 hypothetical protein EA663_13365 [Pseudoxanthomonas winnipegensis]TAA33716.1 hypothetical protein EA656_14860 [Pseudoxanthomonas winnipegensis]